MKHTILFITLIILFLINNIKNNIENFQNFKNDKNIIIIGNAPYTNKNGKFIDSFDKVIRFNNFNIEKEHQQYIGSKIDIWCLSCFVYFSNKKLFEEKKNNIKDILVFKPEVFKDKYLYKPQNNTKLILQNKDVEVPYNFGKKWPSTGLLAVFYFLQQYPQVYVTGFNHFDDSNGSIHYYENLKQIGHKGDLEKKIFNDLKLKRKIIIL